jgi:NAD(P)-dependent dehydrogenase (short-subunit alcohol dehydrogenase family)
MFEANYWGPIRMIQSVLPSMRERRAGCIVNVTSIAGRIATPNQIPYSASKHALAAASEALAHEVAAFGVRVAAWRQVGLKLFRTSYSMRDARPARVDSLPS